MTVGICHADCPATVTPTVHRPSRQSTQTSRSPRQAVLQALPITVTATPILWSGPAFAGRHAAVAITNRVERLLVGPTAADAIALRSGDRPADRRGGRVCHRSRPPWQSSPDEDRHGTMPMMICE